MARWLTTLITTALLVVAFTGTKAQVAIDGPLSHSTESQQITARVAPTEYNAVRLTNDGAESVNPRAVVDADFLYVTWEDTRDGNREIYWQKFSRSTGTSATSTVRVTNTGASSIEPAIGVDGSGNSYVVWQEGTLYGTIMGAKVGPDGTILVAPVALSPNLCLRPDIATRSNGESWVVFERRSASDQDCYIRRFNSSLVMTCDKRANEGTLPAIEKAPVVAVGTDGSAYCFRRDLDMWWQDGIYYEGAPANCGNLGGRLQVGGSYAWPAIGYSGTSWWGTTQVSGNVYLLYGTTSIYRVNDVSGTAGAARVGDDPDFAYCVWSDTRDGHSEIYLSQAYQNTAFPDEKLTIANSSKGRPDIATDNSLPGIWWVVWSDNRDGNSEIYLTGNGMVLPGPHITVDAPAMNFQALRYAGVPASQQLTITNTGESLLDWSIEDDAAWLDVNPTNGQGNSQAVTVSILTTNLPTNTYNATITITSDNANNSPVTVPVLYTVGEPVPCFVVKDGASTPQPITNHLCRVYRIAEDFTETDLGEAQTDAGGILVPQPDWFTVNNRVKIVVVAHRMETNRGHHEAVGNTAHRIFLDNATVQSEGPLLYEDRYAGTPLQDVVLKHTTVKYNLVAAFQWDISPDQFQSFKTALQKVANYMYDISDGQAVLDTVAVYDEGYTMANTPLWAAADMKIHAVDFMGTGAYAVPGYIPSGTDCRSGGTYYPRAYYTDPDHGPSNIVSTVTFGVNWSIPHVGYDGIESFYPGVKALTHELAHYLLYLGDEYRDRYDGRLQHCAGTVPATDFGIMDSRFCLNNPIGAEMNGEMSSQHTYTTAGSHFTHQWCWHEQPCWETFESFHQVGSWQDCHNPAASFPFANIVRPQEQEPVVDVFTGPNNDLDHPDVDWSNAITVRDMTGAYASLDRQWSLIGVNVIGRVEVSLQKHNGGVVIDQGVTTESGEIILVGTQASDIARALWTDPFGVRMQVAEWTIENGAAFATRSAAATPMVEIVPHQPLAISLKGIGSQSFQFVADGNSSFASPPSIDVLGDYGSRVTEPLNWTGNGYESSSGIAGDERGRILLKATDDSAHSFVIPIAYQWTSAGPGSRVLHLDSDDRLFSMDFDSVSTSLPSVLVSRYRYLVPRNGLPETGVFSSAIYSVTAYPGIDSLTGDNYVTISYSGPDSLQASALNMAIYWWNSTARNWETLPTLVLDTAGHFLEAKTSRLGLFMLAASPKSCCTGTTGNVNASGIVDLSDLSALVSYLTGGGYVLPCVDEANINNAGIVDLSDLSALVSYLTGGGYALPNCP